HLDAALRLDPQSVEANYNVGLALAAERRLAESAEHFTRALALQPDHLAARVNLGAVLRAQRRFDESIEQLRAALKIDASNAAAHAAAGDFRRAVEIAESALQIAARRGRSDDASLVRARADLYRHHRPYRDSMLVER